METQVTEHVYPWIMCFYIPSPMIIFFYHYLKNNKTKETNTTLEIIILHIHVESLLWPGEGHFMPGSLSNSSPKYTLFSKRYGRKSLPLIHFLNHHDTSNSPTLISLAKSWAIDILWLQPYYTRHKKKHFRFNWLSICHLSISFNVPLFFFYETRRSGAPD